MTTRTDRLARYLKENPRSGPRIIYILCIALMLSSTVILVQAMNLGQYSEPPHPSENTPITLTEEGIVWTASYDSWVPTNYTFMRWHWSKQTAGSSVSFDLPLANLTSQHMLNLGTQASVEVLYATITDILGDGEFNTGDQILFNGDPNSEFPVEGTIYRLAIVFIGWTGELEDEENIGNFDIVDWGEYSCTVEGGKFYSWKSNDLLGELPWWYGDKWMYDPSPF